jgi:hypothetical protein
LKIIGIPFSTINGQKRLQQINHEKSLRKLLKNEQQENKKPEDDAHNFRFDQRQGFFFRNVFKSPSLNYRQCDSIFRIYIIVLWVHVANSTTLL